jgi:hypothetical protein
MYFQNRRLGGLKEPVHKLRIFIKALSLTKCVKWVTFTLKEFVAIGSTKYDVSVSLHQ